MSEALAIAILGSGVISALVSSVTTLIVRAMDKKDSDQGRLEALEKKMNKAELDSVRLQMMVLMTDFPEDKQEILRVAEHYFKDLHGNWFATSLFYKFLEENDIAEPEWFNKEV